MNSDHMNLNNEEAFFRRKAKKNSFYNRFKDSEGDEQPEMQSFKNEDNDDMDEDGDEENSEEQFYEHYEFKIVASTRTQHF